MKKTSSSKEKTASSAKATEDVSSSQVEEASAQPEKKASSGKGAANKATSNLEECLHYGTDVKSLELSFEKNLIYDLLKDEYSGTKRDYYKSLALTVRDRLAEKWIKTQQTYYEEDSKRVYYLSLEYLMGRTLGNALVNLGLTDNAERALLDLGHDLETLREMEWDAGLGNGGLGRLAACFLDSFASCELPVFGYGIRYDYGIFFQKLRNGYQVETPDNWLRYGNPWEIERPENLYPVKFYGRVDSYKDNDGHIRYAWVDTREVLALGYDTPIPGYNNNTVNNMRLWSARSTRDFQFDYFEHGDYERAVADKVLSENITKVLYPNDNFFEGKELRLKQQYFLVCATIQDLIRRYKKKKPHGWDFRDFPDKVAIQLNDTHPAIAVAELMRVFIDGEMFDWDYAWDLTKRTFGYTNHTVMPEALERWSVSLLERVLPRHLQIIYEINRRFLDEVKHRFPSDNDRLARMSLIGEGADKRVRMANMAVVGSHSVNGVSALHSEILKKMLFKDFYEMWPEKFNNKTNGITQRRWLKLCNPGLSGLITEAIGDKWASDLFDLKRLEPLVEDSEFRKRWHKIKHDNKEHLSICIREDRNCHVSYESMFDCQVKRIHEYKRQILNAFHLITMYNRIKDNPKGDFVPRTVIFGGKAAPGYAMAKLIIKFLNNLCNTINNDPDMGDKLRALFIENYSVTVAERLMPAADLSEQISTAGTEASGTGNMKFTLNGALTIGTLDGANIEIREEVGEENIFIFGMNEQQVEKLKSYGYNSRLYYEKNAELRRVIDMISSNYFSKYEPGIFNPIVDSLLSKGDKYMVLADYASFVDCQQKVSELYLDAEAWTKMSILNVARVGKFSSDRTVMEYARDIWNVGPVKVKPPVE